MSPKITLALCLYITCLLQKCNFAFTLRKNWSGQNRSSRTDSTGPVPIMDLRVPLALHHFHISVRQTMACGFIINSHG